jgi:transcriptional regulator with XRE-family HTH domain
MEKTTRLLDQIKEKHGLQSDNALAAKLGVRRQRVSNFYKGERAPDNTVCKRIAVLLNKPLSEIISLVEIDTAKDEKKRSEWREYYNSIGGYAASITAALLFFPELACQMVEITTHFIA